MGDPHEPVVESLGPAACRSWLVGCAETREAVVVDPLAEGAVDVLSRAGRAGWNIVLAIDTHTHADHLSGGPAFAAVGIPYALHESTESAAATERVRDGETIDVGRMRMTVLHTPGHTRDSVTLVCGRRMFTGDFLFLGQDGAGRLDLPGGDAGAHWDSLRRIASVADDAIVHPGHDYEGLDRGTLGEERRRNPRFQNVTREEYVAWQRAIASDTPTWMLDVLAANLGTGGPHASHGHERASPGGAASCPAPGACLASPSGRVPLVSVEEAARRMSRPSGERPFLLDVREPYEFHGPMGRHAPGAVLVPLATVPTRLDVLPVAPDAEILVICKSGGRSARAAEFLIETGRRRVFNVAGGTDAWVRAGLPVER